MRHHFQETLEQIERDIDNLRKEAAEGNPYSRGLFEGKCQERDTVIFLARKYEAVILECSLYHSVINHALRTLEK